MEPLVDINIAVYNQAPFLRKALNGVLEQKTSFKFRLLIGDDCSTDGSIDILKEYERKHPDLIKVIYQPSNLGFHSKERNGTILLKHSTAKYIALLDGDDYWFDANKLQLQVEFLEQNSDYSICFHSIYELLGNKLRISPFYKSKREATYTIEDLAKGNFISTASVVFRNRFERLPNWFNEISLGDYSLHMLNAQHGKIKYFPIPMSVYRIHNANIWGGKSFKYQCENTLKVLDVFINHFQNSQQVTLNLKHQYARWKFQMAEISLKDGDTKGYIENIKEAFLISPAFMEEWLLGVKSDYVKLQTSIEYKLGWALRNPWFMVKKYTSAAFSQK